MVVNRSAPPGPVAPHLIYEDPAAAIAWLCRAFGFRERYRYGRDGGVEGALLAVGDGAVMIASPRVGYGAAKRFTRRPPRPEEGSHSIGVRVEDVDGHYERAKASGARILLAPETYPFGERQYTAQDCGGHLWTFSESVEDVAPEAWGAFPAATG